MTFSEIIRNRRLELGLTLEEVADAVGVKKSTILRWENGEINNPRRDRIALLAAILQLPPMALVTEQFGPPEKTAEEVHQIVSEGHAKRLQQLDDDLLDLLVDLTPEEQQRVRDFAAGVKSSRKA